MLAIEQRNSVLEFWKKCKVECLEIRSIKQVYLLYKDYAISNGLVVQNEYKFRHFIRKNGYTGNQV